MTPENRKHCEIKMNYGIDWPTSTLVMSNSTILVWNDVSIK